MLSENHKKLFIPDTTCVHCGRAVKGEGYIDYQETILPVAQTKVRPKFCSNKCFSVAVKPYYWKHAWPHEYVHNKDLHRIERERKFFGRHYTPTYEAETSKANLLRKQGDYWAKGYEDYRAAWWKERHKKLGVPTVQEMQAENEAFLKSPEWAKAKRDLERSRREDEARLKKEVEQQKKADAEMAKQQAEAEARVRP